MGRFARSGLILPAFGVAATRRPLDQIVNAVAYPHLPVRIIGFMPGVSSPGGPSHQAIEDVALMRALPGMTIVEVADATETAQVVAAIADLPGPVYLRLKRGEIPVIFPQDHRLSLDHAQVLVSGCDRTRRATGTAGGGVTTGGGAENLWPGGTAAAPGPWQTSVTAVRAGGVIPGSGCGSAGQRHDGRPALAAPASCGLAGCHGVLNIPVIKPLDAR
jgi:hypothetical protein